MHFPKERIRFSKSVDGRLSEEGYLVLDLKGLDIEGATSFVIEMAEIEGHPIATHAMVIDHIGVDDGGKPIEVLFGALAMQQWGIRLIPEQEKLDLTHYPKEFVEFTGR